MTEKRTKQPVLSIVHNEARAGDSARSAGAAIDALRGRLRAPGDVMPADPTLLRRLLGLQDNLTNTMLSDQIDRAVERGVLRRVIIEREAHLTLGASTSGEQPPAAVERTEDQRFEEALRLDVETERLVLYRVAIVVELIVASTLLRALLLTGT